ncbi:MAG: hypothetical protein V4722_03765 [Bacteroidota bacterium]
MDTTTNATDELLNDQNQQGHFQNSDAQNQSQPGGADETEAPSIVNEQGEDVVNEQGNDYGKGDDDYENDKDVPASTPGGDDAPPEVEIDPETPTTEPPTMAS